MKSVILLLTFILSVSVTGCFMDAGTHGSIKSYHFKTTKDKLERAVKTVINNNSNIHHDTTNSNYIIDVTNGKHDTIISNYYNDGKTYVSIDIKTNSMINEYIFRYSGSEEHWKLSAFSSISICYAYDKEGKGGSEGNGDFPWHKCDLKKKFTNLFETEFIYKLDKELNMSHE